MIEGYLTIRPAARKGYGSIAHEADRQLVGQTKAIIKLENASWRKVFLGNKTKEFRYSMTIANSPLEA